MADAAEIPDLAALLRDDAWLRRLALRLVGRAEDADDLVQEALLVAVGSPPREPARFGAWIKSVLRHLASHRGERERERPARELAAAQRRSGANEVELVQQVRLRHLLMDAVLGLPEPWQSAVVLKYYADLSSAEIAEKLGAPEGTVRYWLHRATEALRARLQQERGTADGDLRPLLMPFIAAGGLGNAAGTATGGAVAAGALVMSVKTQVAAALLVLVALCGGAWWFMRTDDAESPRSSGSSPRDRVADAEDRSAPKAAAPITGKRFVDAAPPMATGKDASWVTTGNFPSGSLKGRVLAANGDPVPGIEVFAGAPNYGPSHDDRREAVPKLIAHIDETAIQRLPHSPPVYRGDWRHARTDADGRFTMNGVPEWASTEIWTFAEEHGTAVESGVAVVRNRVTEIDLKFAPGIVLSGVVSYENGAHCEEGYQVIVRPVQADGEPSRTQREVFKTNAEGEYRTYPLAGRKLSITACEWGCAPGLKIDVEPGERSRRIDLVVAPLPQQGKRLEGRLVASDGSKIPALDQRLIEVLGASVARDSWEKTIQIWGSDTNPQNDHGKPRTTVSRGDLMLRSGRWMLRPSANRPHFVSIWCRGVLVGSAELVDDAPAPELAIDFSRVPIPKPVGSILVRARDAATGAPARVYATAEVPSAEKEAGPRDTATYSSGWSEGGEARIDGLEAGIWRLTLIGAWYVDWSTEVVVKPGSEPTIVEATIGRPDATLSGRVVDSAGKPVVGADIVILRPDGTPASSMGNNRATTNRDGRFLNSTMVPGAYLVTVYDSNYPVTNYAFIAFPVRTDAESEQTLVLREGVAVTFEVPPDSGAHHLRFRIRDEAGTLAYDNMDIEGRSYDGTTTLRLIPGRYSAEVRCPPFAPARLSFDAVEGARIQVPLISPGAETREGR